VTGRTFRRLAGFVVDAVSRAAPFPPHAIVRVPTSTAPVILRDHMLQARQLTKEYQSGDHRLAVLRDVSFTVPDGAFVAVVGPSGSGKTTLLGLLAGLDVPTHGSVLLDGEDLGASARTAARSFAERKLGSCSRAFN
jgi:predicted ABC-type transport system involved in lysophospholipase L1 biosynthesis ATPase subunit